MPRSSSSTDTARRGSMNMREPSAFHARSDTFTICEGTIVFARSAPNTRYAVISLVSDAGSRRSSAAAAASVCPLVTSTSVQPAAATAGAGMAAGSGAGTTAAGAAAGADGVWATPDVATTSSAAAASAALRARIRSCGMGFRPKRRIIRRRPSSPAFRRRGAAANRGRCRLIGVRAAIRSLAFDSADRGTRIAALTPINRCGSPTRARSGDTRRSRPTSGRRSRRSRDCAP